ncbi:MAG: hypothetical protein KTR26_11335 [Flammeovirgaceae bacterium]|nr:hypothetical protein [Flammeovirgaceae bacterium]
MQRILSVLLFLFLVNISGAFAQKFLVLDKYGKKRIKLSVGDEIYFKQKDNKSLYHDYIRFLGDSTVTIASRDIEMQMDEFDAFYFKNEAAIYASTGTAFIGGGFLFASIVHPLVSKPFYNQEESLYIGATFIATSLIFKALKWKKFKVKKNARVRVLDTTFR